jgi:hypothetical protein
MSHIKSGGIGIDIAVLKKVRYAHGGLCPRRPMPYARRVPHVTEKGYITACQETAPCRFPKIKVLAQVWVLAQVLVLVLALALALALLLGPKLWR